MMQDLAFLTVLPYWYWLLSIGVLILFGARSIRVRVQASRKLQRVLQVVAGFGLWSSTSWVFDNIAYPGVIAWKGLLVGGIIMSTIAIVVTAIFLLVYEYKKIDWMGMDALRSVRDNGDAMIQRYAKRQYRNYLVRWVFKSIAYFPILFFRIALWMLKKGDAFAFIGLSLIADPFITTIYLRHGKFDGLKKKDWMIFIGSGVLSNFYWTLRSYGVVVVISYIIKMFT